MKNWYKGKWADLGKAEVAAFFKSEEYEKKRAFWHEKIPNIDDLESLHKDEIVKIVAGIIYPGIEPDYREHSDIGHLHSIITYMRSLEFNLGDCKIYPDIEDEGAYDPVPDIPENLWYGWRQKLNYAIWDWDDENDLRESSWQSPVVVKERRPELPYNIYGTTVDEYPFYMASKSIVDEALGRYFVVDQYKKENLPVHVNRFMNSKKVQEKKAEYVGECIHTISKLPVFADLPQEKLSEVIRIFREEHWLLKQMMSAMRGKKVWDLFKTPEIDKEIAHLVSIKRVTEE